MKIVLCKLPCLGQHPGAERGRAAPELGSVTRERGVGYCMQVQVDSSCGAIPMLPLAAAACQCCASEGCHYLKAIKHGPEASGTRDLAVVGPNSSPANLLWLGFVHASGVCFLCPVHQ